MADHAEALHERRFFPFPEHDAWIVDPDGRIGVLSAAEYRLRWFKDGRLVATGPPLDHAPVPITAADRDAFRKARLEAPAGAARITAQDPTARRAEPSPAAQRQNEEAFPDAIFPTQNPPFEERGLLRAPSGDLWVVRSMPYGARRARIDILGADGRRRGELDLPEGRRLVGLERGAVWLVRVDDDGLQWLERYAWPVVPR